MVMEGLYHSKADLVVYLHPSKAKSPSDAILGELSSLLFTYSVSLDGVILAFDPKISSLFAQIISGISPYLGVKVRAELLVFSPKPNMTVEGEVVTVTPHAINAVVLGFSSASIAREDVRGEFRFRSKKGAYVSGLNRKHKIGVGTILRFRVNCFDGETLHVSGSLVGEDTGCVKWLDRNVDVWNQVESTGGRSIVKEENGCVNEDMVSMMDDGRKVKKLKKARVKQEEEDVKGMDEEMMNNSKKTEVKVGDSKEESGLEVKKETLVLNDGEKLKSKKMRAREEDNGLVIKQDMPSLKEEEEKPKKSKKRRKEQS